jgi:hypothetical protein
MSEGNAPHRPDEGAFSTHARTIAKALSLPGGTANSGDCQKSVIKTYR